MSMRFLRFLGYCMTALGIACVVMWLMDSEVFGSAGNVFLILGITFIPTGIFMAYLGHQLSPADDLERPSMRQGLQQATAAMQGYTQQQQEAQRLSAQGSDGRATVVSVHDTGTMINYDPVVDMDLDVQSSGGTPYRVTHREAVSKVMLGRIAPGSSLPVKVDPFDGKKVSIAWLQI